MVSERTIDSTPPVPLIQSNDLSYVAGTAGNWTITWSRSTGTSWPGNRDQLEAATNEQNFAHFRLKAQVTTSGDHVGSNYLLHTARITEIELANGHIYTPPLAGNGLIQPMHGQCGTIHLPWLANDDELVAFYGANDRSAGDDPALMRSLTGTPALSEATYGVQRGPFGIRSYDNDRTYAALAGWDGSAYALLVSDDGGDSWAVVAGPDAAGDPHATEVAFGADSADVLFAWGTEGTILYASNFGVAFDSRIGNLAAINGGTAPDLLVGICGGPTG